jgi:hypothetical protein
VPSRAHDRDGSFVCSLARDLRPLDGFGRVWTGADGWERGDTDGWIFNIHDDRIWLDRPAIERRGPRVWRRRRPPLVPDSIDWGTETGGAQAVLYRSFLPAVAGQIEPGTTITDFRRPPSRPPPRAPFPRTRQRWTAALVSRNETSKMRSTMGRNTTNRIKHRGGGGGGGAAAPVDVMYASDGERRRRRRRVDHL